MNNIDPKLLTLSAIIIGYVLIDELNSTEQNALGNWFMLIGQVLCTNGSENFRRDYQGNFNNNNYNNNNYNNTRTTKDILNKVNDTIKNTIDKL